MCERSAVSQRLPDASAEIGILQWRDPRHRLGAGGRPILITDGDIELGEGEIPANVLDDIVKMVRAADGGFGEFTTENILNHQCCDAALSPGGIFARPEAAGLARPAFP